MFSFVILNIKEVGQGVVCTNINHFFRIVRRITYIHYGFRKHRISWAPYPQTIVASPWCSQNISFRPWHFEPLPEDCRCMIDTWSPRSAIRGVGPEKRNYHLVSRIAIAYKPKRTIFRYQAIARLQFGNALPVKAFGAISRIFAFPTVVASLDPAALLRFEYRRMFVYSFFGGVGIDLSQLSVQCCQSIIPAYQLFYHSCRFVSVERRAFRRSVVNA